MTYLWYILYIWNLFVNPTWKRYTKQKEHIISYFFKQHTFANIVYCFIAREDEKHLSENAVENMKLNETLLKLILSTLATYKTLFAILHIFPMTWLPDPGS